MPLKIIKTVDGVEKDKIITYKNNLLKRIDHSIDDFYWFFGLNTDFLTKMNLIAVPCLGSDQFMQYEDDRLIDIVNLMKKWGGGTIYLSSLNELQNELTSDVFYKAPCTIEAIREYGMSLDEFRYNGYTILISENFKFSLLMEWDMDIIIGENSFVEEYFLDSVQHVLEKYKEVYKQPIEKKSQLLLDISKRLNELGYKKLIL